MASAPFPPVHVMRIDLLVNSNLNLNLIQEQWSQADSTQYSTNDQNRILRGVKYSDGVFDRGGYQDATCI